MSEELVISTVGKNSKYNRSHSPDYDKLESTLKKNYGVNGCHVTSSGMNAISTLFHGLFIRQRYNLIYSSELYSDVPKLFKLYNELYEINLREFVIRSETDIVDAFEQFRGQENILYVESCSNPNGHLFDFSKLARLREISKSLLVVVDNTWLTEVILNPFEYDLNNSMFVVVSLTKYYSAGTAIGGAILSNNWEIMKSVAKWSITNGQHVSPHNCRLINERIESMRSRIERSSKLTKEIIEFLRTREDVFNLSYPHFDSLGPSVVTFMLKCSKKKFIKACMSNEILDYKTSFGSAMSKVDPYPGIVIQEEIKYTLARLALGFEDSYDRVVTGLTKLLQDLDS